MIKLLKHISVLSIAAAVFALAGNASAETFSGYLDENTKTMLHSITLPSDGEVRVAVSIDSTLSLATSLYTGITIFDSNGTTQLEGFSVDTGSTAGEFGPFPLKAGNYYLRVSRAYGYGSYTLTVNHSPQPLTNDTEPNNTSAAAKSAAVGSSITGHLGYIGGGGGTAPDELDWWILSIPSDGEVRIAVSIDSTLSLATSLYTGITIFDSNGTTQLEGFSVDTGSTAGDFGPFPLKAGNYYLRVSRAYGYGGYTLTVNHSPQPLTNDTEPNNTSAAAKSAAVGSSITGHLGYIGGSGGTAPDELDWWSFTMPAPGDLRLSITIDPTLNLVTSYYHGISILAGDGTTEVQGFSGPQGQSDISKTYGPFYLDAGTFYLRLSRALGYGGYSVQLTSDTISSTTTTAPPASTTSTTISDGQGADLLNLAEWDVYGSASADNNELIFGDSIGSDPQDQDSDGNPENTWMKGSAGAGPGDDYDWIVSKKEFSPPLTLTWSGCFPTTAYGYQYAALAGKNPAFTGAAGSGQSVIDWNNMLAFHTSWEYANALLSFTRKAGQNTINTVPGAAPGGHGICGEFKIVWENNKAAYYFNDAQVDQQDAAYFGPVRIFFRSYENPFNIDSISVLSASPNTTTTAAPVTSTTTAPETTTTTSISSVTTTIAIPCPIQRTLNCREDVDALRLLRDIRFMNATGIFITYIYYKNSAEISAILEEHPELQQQMKALADDNISVARELVNKGAAVISPGAVDDITRFLENLRQNSSPGLQADIQLIINGIKNRRLVEGIGVKVK